MFSGAQCTHVWYGLWIVIWHCPSATSPWYNTLLSGAALQYGTYSFSSMVPSHPPTLRMLTRSSSRCWLQLHHIGSQHSLSPLPLSYLTSLIQLFKCDFSQNTITWFSGFVTMARRMTLSTAKLCAKGQWDPQLLECQLGSMQRSISHRGESTIWFNSPPLVRVGCSLYSYTLIRCIYMWMILSWSSMCI